MSVGIAVSLGVLATLGIAFVFKNASSPQRVEPSSKNMEELKHKLKRVEKARKAYMKKEADDEVKKNQKLYEDYVSILDQ
jgi:hypothetical protein